MRRGFKSQARHMTQVLMTWEAPPLLMSNRSASISFVIAALSLRNTKVNSSFTDSFLCGPIFFRDALKFHLEILDKIAFFEPDQL